MKKAFLAFGAAVTLLMAGCLKDDSDNSGNQSCNYDPCATKAPDSQKVAVKAYLDSAGLTATEHCSGMYYNIEDTGSGKAAVACSGVYVQYKGRFTNGNIFDSTRANDSVGFYLNQVISGWTKGVPLVKEGGTINLYIPPALGYGSQPYQGIPGNSILVFEVKLLKVVI